MKIAFTLVFTLTVNFHPIECIKEGLDTLYPGVKNDAWPRVKTVSYSELSEKFKKILPAFGKDTPGNSVPKFNENTIFVKRYPAIIGWLYTNQYNIQMIEPISDLLGRIDHVYNESTNKLHKLDQAELTRLGVFNTLNKALEHDFRIREILTRQGTRPGNRPHNNQPNIEPNEEDIGNQIQAIHDLHNMFHPARAGPSHFP